VRSEIDGVSAVGVGLDIGGKMDLEPLIKHRVSLGFGVGNVGIAQPQFNNRKETMPAFVRMGVAYRVEPIEGHALLAVFDLNRQTSDSFTFHPGVEWKIRDRISMRLGYDGRNDAGTGVTTGVGWSFKDFGLNYAFVPFGDLGDAHKISLSYRWGPDEGPTKMSRGPSATGRKEMKRSSIMPEIQELPKYREPTYKPLPEGDNRPKRPRYFDADKSIGG
jgi:hypothetical protein